MALFINGVGQDTFSMNGVSIDNLYVDDVLVWSLATGVAPIYLLTEPLVNDGSFDYLDNSASSGSQFDAKLLQSDGITAWNPTAQEYPGDETAVIDFGTNHGDTQWTPPQDEEYTFTFVENVGGGSYDMVSINPKGDGTTADVLYDGVLTAENTGRNYTPPVESVKLTENMSETIVPMTPYCETIELSQYTFGVGDTATVTMTFNTISYGFTLADTSAQNGTLSNLTQDTNSPWIFTATFTPDAEVSDDTNIIAVYGGLGAYEDAWGNLSSTDAQSANYTINTVSLVNLVQDSTFSDGPTTIHWTPRNAVLSWDEPGFVGNLTVQDAGSWSSAEQEIELETNTLYNIEYTYENRTSDANNAFIGVSDITSHASHPPATYNNEGSVQTNTTGWVTFSDTFTSDPTDTTHFVDIFSNSTLEAYFKEVKIWKA